MAAALVPIQTRIELDVGERILLVGTNPSSTDQFPSNEDRYHFMTVSELEKLRELPVKNVKVILINEKINSNALEHFYSLLDKLEEFPLVLTLQNGGRFAEMMRHFPFDNPKGVVGMEVFGVSHTIESTTKHSGPIRKVPAKPEEPPATQHAPKPEQVPDPAPQMKISGLNQLLGRLEEIYRDFSGKSGHIIAYFRKCGITPEKMTDSALRQRIYRIRDKHDHADSKPTVSLSPANKETFDSDKAKRLEAAVENLNSAYQSTVAAFVEVLQENTHFKKAMQQMALQNAAIPGLKERLNRFLKAAGLPEEV